MKLQVTNIDRNVSEEDFRGLFERFGEIIECTLVMDAETGASKGFGFVVFADKLAAQEAAKRVNLRLVNDQEIKVKIIKI